MEITESRAGGVTVAALAGRLDVATAAAAETGLLAMVGRGGPVLVDLSGVSYVSSAGLRVLLRAAKQAQIAGHALALAAPQPAVQEVLEISGFPAIMPVHETREAGLAAQEGG